MSYSEVVIKHPNQMTTAELKAHANKEAVTFYRQQYEQNPTDPQAKYEYENACQNAGVEPNPEVNRLKSLSRAQLAAEWTTKGQAIEAANQDEWQAATAATWIASQPAYAVTPENADKLVAELNSRGLRGSVNDLAVCFDHLVAHGDIQPKPRPVPPVKLLSNEELGQMSASQIKAYIEDASRKGIL